MGLTPGSTGRDITRDLLPTPTLFAMRHVRSITSVFSDHLGWHRAWIKFMARCTAAPLWMTTAKLHRLILALKGSVEAASTYRRIQRFFSNYDMTFRVLDRLLVRLGLNGPCPSLRSTTPSGTSARCP